MSYNVLLKSLFVKFLLKPNVAFSRGTGWRGLCPAQTVTDRTVGYNAWFGVPFDDHRHKDNGVCFSCSSIPSVLPIPPFQFLWIVPLMV
jgi:hypothetical protein